MAQGLIRRTVDVCPHCGAWDSFRKGRLGRSMVDRHTGLRRIYGTCRKCGCKLVVQYTPPPLR